MSLPTAMKGVCLTGFGDVDQLEYREDIPVPVPSAGEVLVEVAACGMNNTDIWTREGRYGETIDCNDPSGWQGSEPGFPRIQGADLVGKIVAVGEEVDESRIGERVIVNPQLYTGAGIEGLYDSGLIGSERDGGFAEYTAVPASSAIAIESDYSDAELATFMISYLTAEHMLNRGRVSAQDTVLITGASGGVGSALIQLVKRRGAKVVAIVGKGKADQAKSIGADTVLIRGENILKGLKSQGIDSVSAVMDVVGGDQVDTLLDALKTGGRFVISGAIAGCITQIDWKKVYLKHLDILGSTMGTQEEGEDLVAYISNKEIKPLLAKTFPLANLPQAQQFFKEKKHFGNLVITHPKAQAVKKESKGFFGFLRNIFGG